MDESMQWYREDRWAPGRSDADERDHDREPLQAMPVPGRAPFAATQHAPPSAGAPGRGAWGTTTVPGQSGAGTSAGRRLPGDVRAKMERSFGVDFSSVSVHLGPEAAASGAEAFARGEALHFRPGAYDPHSASGQELLGHELAHVVQQRAGRVSAPQGKGGMVVDASLEAEADAAGARAARGEPAQIAASAAAGAATSAGTSAAQPKLYLGTKTEPEPEIPRDIRAKVLNVHGKAALRELERRHKEESEDYRYEDWPAAARSAFHATCDNAKPREQSLLWYGTDSETRNRDPDHGGPPTQGQFRESGESKRLASDLLGKLALRPTESTLGRGEDDKPKQAIMVGVLITVLGRRYAAKSGNMTDGFRGAARDLGLQVVDRGDDDIIGFGDRSNGDRSNDPVAQLVGSKTPEVDDYEVGQAPGKCALPKLLSEVATRKNDAPESATEKLFSPGGKTGVYVRGEGGSVERHGHGCSVPSCITCRKLAPLQLEGAPTRDEVLSSAEDGYLKHLDQQSKRRNDKAREEHKRTNKTGKNRKRNQRKKGNYDVEVTKVEAPTLERTDRSSDLERIAPRFQTLREEMASLIQRTRQTLEEKSKQQLGVWGTRNSKVGSNPMLVGEGLAAQQLWKGVVRAAMLALCTQLATDYECNAPDLEFDNHPPGTLDELSKRVDRTLKELEDRARSIVARAFGALST